MKRFLGIAPLLLLTSGCAITDRLDLTNQQLGAANSRIGETNQRLADVEAKLLDVNLRIEETNRKMNTVEQAILQSPVLRPNPSTHATVPPPSTTPTPPTP